MLDKEMATWNFFSEQATRKEIYIGNGNMTYILKFIYLAIGKGS